LIESICKNLARETGLEPATSGVTGRMFASDIIVLAFAIGQKTANEINAGHGGLAITRYRIKETRDGMEDDRKRAKGRDARSSNKWLLGR
jgi:hypothetical protein